MMSNRGLNMASDTRNGNSSSLANRLGLASVANRVLDRLGQADVKASPMALQSRHEGTAPGVEEKACQRNSAAGAGMGIHHDSNQRICSAVYLSIGKG